MTLFAPDVLTGSSRDASSPFDKLRVRTTLASVEILMLSLSKHKDFGPSARYAAVCLGSRKAA